MTKLNTTQRHTLAKAAKAADGALEAAEIAKATAAALVRRDLMTLVPHDGGARPVITDTGRAAIGETTPPPLAADPPVKGKIGAMIGLLRQPGGTTVAAMMEITGWQAHSVRGAMSGAIKKDRGLAVVSALTDTGRIYSIAEGAGA